MGICRHGRAWSNTCREARHHFSSVQSLSRVWLFVTPWTAARQASLSITNSWSLLKFMYIELVMPSNCLILCLLLLLPSIFPSIRVFSNESVLCIRRPKYQSFSFSISPSNSYYWTPIEYLLRINRVPTLLLIPQKTKNKKQFLFSQNSESSRRNTYIHIGRFPTILRIMFLKTLWLDNL